MSTDTAILNDLVLFARQEIAAGDVEPWAATLGNLFMRGIIDAEQAAWAVKLYNATDSFATAFRIYERWPSPDDWHWASPSRDDLRAYPCGVERRNLRGGLLARHIDSYVRSLGGGRQWHWLMEPVGDPEDPEGNFDTLMSYMRGSVWGTGRLAAFEWAEFTGKVLGLPVKAGDACLWESSGPRESLERIYNGGRKASHWAQLDEWARECKTYLEQHGAPLEWWDLETVICDFNVMRKGRYYPGQHLAMLREEITQMPQKWGRLIQDALNDCIGGQWARTPPGVDKVLQRAYASTGKIRTPFRGLS